MTTQLYVMQETRVPGENHHITRSHISLIGIGPQGSDVRQLVIGGKASDHVLKRFVRIY